MERKMLQITFGNTGQTLVKGPESPASVLHWPLRQTRDGGRRKQSGDGAKMRQQGHFSRLNPCYENFTLIRHVHYGLETSSQLEMKN